jgi:hypothetical protein
VAHALCVPRRETLLDACTGSAEYVTVIPTHYPGLWGNISALRDQ